ncbi:hypothetical protein F5X96DRAFT_131964 [Biscogniauxia mediterranea]|nr:hypothetical protein F5X96DRAFT_131964 [Biscogniauxia mediterranea]
MFRPDFSKKRFCLQVLLWNGLLSSSRCEDLEASTEILIIGTPVIELATITITTTIAYNPTPAPGDSTTPTLLGCYTQPRDGAIFGPDGRDACSDTVRPSELTIEACLSGCAALMPPPGQTGGERYAFAGLRNGNECICGTQLSPDARAVPADDCETPCAGDATRSCGGRDAIAVYSLASSDDGNNTTLSPQADPDDGTGKNRDQDKTGSPSGSTTQDPLSDHAPTTPSSPEKTTATRSGKTSASPEANSTSTSVFPTPAPAPAPPASASTIAAITGSLSGAVVVGVVLVLCLRAHQRRKKQQRLQLGGGAEAEKNKKKKQEIRQRLSRLIFLAGGGEKGGEGEEEEKGEEKGGTQGRGIANGGGSGSGDGDAAVLGAPPTTPGLESGGGQHGSADVDIDVASAGVLPAAQGKGTTTSSSSSSSPPLPPPPPPPSGGSGRSERDSLYRALLHEVRAGPAAAPPPPPPSSSSFSSTSPSPGIIVGLGISSDDDYHHHYPTLTTPNTTTTTTNTTNNNTTNNNTTHGSSSSVHYAAPSSPLTAAAAAHPAWRHRRKISAPAPAPDFFRMRGSSSSGPPPTAPLPPTPTPPRPQPLLEPTESPVLGGRGVWEEGNGKGTGTGAPVLPPILFDARGWGDADKDEGDGDDEVRTPSTVGTSILFPYDEEEEWDRGERRKEVK